MMDWKQSYEFLRSVFEKYHALQTSLSDRMAQSSTDIGSEASNSLVQLTVNYSTLLIQ